MVVDAVSWQCSFVSCSTLRDTRRTYRVAVSDFEFQSITGSMVRF
ncbi:hypothetical protein [Nodosilinea sp. LEGE 07298]|nr:hypothetical protein [Nodosilinea sp. LEGE 07298]